MISLRKKHHIERPRMDSKVITDYILHDFPKRITALWQNCGLDVSILELVLVPITTPNR
jgi:hypothetical protein